MAWRNLRNVLEGGASVWAPAPPSRARAALASRPCPCVPEHKQGSAERLGAEPLAAQPGYAVDAAVRIGRLKGNQNAHLCEVAGYVERRPREPLGQERGRGDSIGRVPSRLPDRRHACVTAGGPVDGLTGTSRTRSSWVEIQIRNLLPCHVSRPSGSPRGPE